MKPIYTDLQGNPVAADDPNRFFWYAGGKCGMYTDDQSRLGLAGPIPVCPTCNMPGFQTTAAKWDEAVNLYDSTHPGYAAFVAAGMHKCWKAEGGPAAAWEDHLRRSQEVN